ncbi:endonuclease/exonuclease/phosphatase family protein [Flaviaesturariibacter amylovorans]|uniref:Endonuclease/exonuclease/phosphatase family protein n=1 Tax=Flaviaesturariibacter amylovorans TaxID=1084520 RepID=A0ABP8G4X1_9BACT
MDTWYVISALLLIVTSVLAFVPHPHWMFRIWEFGRIQAFVLQLIVLGLGFWLVERGTSFWVLQGALLLLAANNFRILFPYTQLYRGANANKAQKRSESCSILSVNVYQFNTEYDRLVETVRKHNPDVILTMESNAAWEQALSVLDRDYPRYQKVALENTYGMHFWTRLAVHRLQVHYFVADDLPSIEAELSSPDGTRFTLFGVHPAPPSPTEEPNSKERDGELLSVAKKVKDLKGPVLVVGDFNNVAWARSSVLFRKTSGLIDPRIGRGFISTYHARYRLLRFPIDLFFHSTEVFVEEFCTLDPVGSDHLPLYCRFYFNNDSPVQEAAVEDLEPGQMSEVNEMIEEGKEEESDRPAVAKE